MLRVRSAVALIAWLIAAVPAAAHPVPFSYLDLTVRSDGPLQGVLVVHVFDAAHELGIPDPDRLLDPGVLATVSGTLTRTLGPRLRVVADGRILSPEWSAAEPLPDRQSILLRLTYATATAPGRIAVSAALFPYDPAHQTFVNIYEGGRVSQAILDAGHPDFEYFAGMPQSVGAVIRKFVPAGIHHILIGPDHLLFLFGLLLLGGRIRQLAMVVTAFTVAHSVTLSLAALDIVTPPSRVIEPAIALSIVYVGADNLLASGGRDVRAWIAFAFGFVHGFGFASVLREMDLPRPALGWSLFAFNLGVEIGQLVVVAVVASIVMMVRARSETAARRLTVGGSIVVVTAGTFWFVQRLLFPARM